MMTQLFSFKNGLWKGIFCAQKIEISSHTDDDNSDDDYAKKG